MARRVKLYKNLIWKVQPRLIVLQSDLKKSRICPIWGQSDQLLRQTWQLWSWHNMMIYVDILAHLVWFKVCISIMCLCNISSMRYNLSSCLIVTSQSTLYTRPTYLFWRVMKWMNHYHWYRPINSIKRDRESAYNWVVNLLSKQC